jgi:hypothetical protein
VNRGRFLAVLLGGATVLLVAIGTLWPTKSAAVYAGSNGFLESAATPESAVRNLGEELRQSAWQRAYDGLGNRAQFTEQRFLYDLMGYYPNLRTFATVDRYEVRPLHSSPTEAEVQLKIYWATVVGPAPDTRVLRVLKNGDTWQPEWPLGKQPALPPQVIPVNYLRWDVIYRGAGDDWAAQDVEAPHVRIIDMRPVERADGVVVLGELLNEDVVPAAVSVNATLLSKKDQSPIATEGSFDKISHLLLPKQVTPFLIRFPNVSLSDVGSIRMTPFSNLISASADPIIEIQDEKLNPAPDASVAGQLTNQSGQIVNVAHVLASFYDKSGNVVWVADQYIDRALLPQTPVPFDIHLPEDLARKVSSERTVVATYVSGGARG